MYHRRIESIVDSTMLMLRTHGVREITLQHARLVLAEQAGDTHVRVTMLGQGSEPIIIPMIGAWVVTIGHTRIRTEQAYERDSLVRSAPSAHVEERGMTAAQIRKILTTELMDRTLG